MKICNTEADRGLCLRLSRRPHDQRVGPSLASTLSTETNVGLDQSGAFYHLEIFAHFLLSLSVIQVDAIDG